MQAARIMAEMSLIVGSGVALHVARAQQPGIKRTEIQRYDLGIPGREVVHTIVELAPGTMAPRHTHPGEEIIYVLEGTWEYTVEGKLYLNLNPKIQQKWEKDISGQITKADQNWLVIKDKAPGDRS